LLPGFEDVAVFFLDPAGQTLASVGVDQTTPGYQVLHGPLAGVSGIAFPSGAFYDDLVLTPIPEVSATPLISALGLLGLGMSRRRTH
jgi:hypothetical protein